MLTAAELARLAKRGDVGDTGRRSSRPEELSERRGASATVRRGTLTWRFRAHNVRDVAWAAAPDYQWDAELVARRSGPGLLPAERGSRSWKDAADMARMSIEEYSTRWFPYPYPQITAVEGPVSGMEYPMLAMEDRRTTTSMGSTTSSRTRSGTTGSR